MQKRFILKKLAKKWNTQYFGIYDTKLKRQLTGVDGLPYPMVNKIYATCLAGVLNKSLEEK